MFIVGIDLGTTNCAAAYAEISASGEADSEIKIFRIPQLVRPGAVEPRELLPSFLYLAAPGELPEGSAALPWNENNSVIVGELARNLGAGVPGRLAASAKSWLCNPAVDRTAAILPWGAGDDVKRISPLDASAAYLAHIRDGWNFEFARESPKLRLELQEIVITVPASFDEAARELTVEAARKVGLVNLTLLEEPQAAFYAWLHRHEKKLGKNLENVRSVLVCDVGGGTTDFSLIEIKRGEKNAIELTRSAVGDHLLLGGDNMDLALARRLEKKIAAKLEAHQFKALVASSRNAKERVFGEKAPEKVPVTVVGRGTSVIGGSLRTELTRDDANTALLDGFFPPCALTDSPARTAAGGIREWGLPYAQDTAITRHLAQFLRLHASSETGTSAPPDTVLFNGGAMKPEAFRERILKVTGSWFSNSSLRELESESLDLAVAAGAAYYGRTRRGQGRRIGGGMGRSYYIGVEADPAITKSKNVAICLVPQGTEESQKLEMNQSFILRLATPVALPVFSSTVRGNDKLGQIIDEGSEELTALPPLETVMPAGRRAKRDVAVHLVAELTPIGTLALTLKSIYDDRQWEIHLNVRKKMEQPGADGTGIAGEITGEAESPALPELDAQRAAAAIELIKRAFDAKHKDPLKPEALSRQLETTLMLPKEAWPAPIARQLADVMLDYASSRKRGVEHESRWLNVIGFLLRPGFGFVADAERMRRLYNATRNGLFFVSDPNARIEWWVLWRRLSGGLKDDHQRELFYKLQPFLSNDRDVSKRGGWPRPSKGEVPEMWRAAGSLELLDLPQKKLLGKYITQTLEKEGPSHALLWAFGRLGARIPAYGAVNVAVPVEIAEGWLQTLHAIDWIAHPQAIFAAVNLSRKTGDHARDIGEVWRNRTIEKLKKSKATEHDIRAVNAVLELETTDRKMIFGDAPPPALRFGTA